MSFNCKMHTKLYFCSAVIYYLLFMGIKSVNSANILGVFTVESKSHTILGASLMKGLAQRGHNVTFITPFPKNETNLKYRQIGIRNPRFGLIPNKNNSFIWNFITGWDTFAGSMFHVNNNGIKLTNHTLNDPNVRKLLNSKQKFDLIIAQVYLGEGMFVLGHYYNAPVVAFCTMGPSLYVNKLVGNPSQYSYVPSPFSSYTDHMTFPERFSNFFNNLRAEMHRKFYYFPELDKIIKMHFKNAPSMDDMSTNVSLVLLNSHFSFGVSQALLPNMVEIAGFHVEPPKKLPNNIQEFLDESKEGVIFFSMGTNVRSTSLSDSNLKAILTAFSEIKQRVLWKWEEDVLPGKPENVKISKWLPQQDILAHPNVLAFVYQGGLLSSIEAITRKVPVIGIPVYSDQYANMAQIISLGCGIALELNNITKRSIYWAINEIINNTKYKENMEKHASLLNDQNPKPLEKAIYWIEYVLRYKGAEHLRSPALDLTWYQHLLFDVVLFIALSVATFYYLTRKAVQFCLKSDKKLRLKKE